MSTPFSPTLTRLCAKHNIRIDNRYSSPDLIVLRHVPVEGTLFNKLRTNMCIVSEPTPGITVWVDADLRALHPESAAARVLSGKHSGNWQFLDHGRQFGSIEEAMQFTLDLLRQAGPLSGPATGPAEVAPLLGRILPMVAIPLDVTSGEPHLIGRDRPLELAERVARLKTRGIMFAGSSGVGLTSCALETLHRVAGTGRAVRVDCSLIATEMVYPASTDERWRQLLAECLAAETKPHFLFDGIQWVLRAGPLTQGALVTALDRGLQFVGAYQSDLLSPARVLPVLARRLLWIDLPPLEPDDLAEVLRRRAEILSVDHDVCIDPATIAAVLHAADSQPGGEPARALQLLESAAALAESGACVGPDEVFAAAQTCCRVHKS